jgi:hypothetical protein
MCRRPAEHSDRSSAHALAGIGRDGNLVIYDLRNGHKVIWSSQTYEKAVDHAIMQPDGNFVIYGYPVAVWATNTYGHGACYITLQDDGNLVLYQISAPVWGSKG